MADTAGRSLRDVQARNSRRIVGRSAAAALAYVLASRAFGSSPAEALWGASGVLLVLFALQTWDVVRHGPGASGDEFEEERRREDDWRPPAFGNGWWWR